MNIQFVVNDYDFRGYSDCLSIVRHLGIFLVVFYLHKFYFLS